MSNCSNVSNIVRLNSIDIVLKRDFNRVMEDIYIVNTRKFNKYV